MSAALTIPPWLERLYPYQPKAFVTPRGARLSYLDEGPRATDAVLMLHGNPTWSFHFRYAIRALAPTRRCIVPDHIGMGLSDKPENYAYTLENRIADIEALVQTLGLKRVDLIVHDWGGAIGFGFAARHSDSIGRVVVLNTAAFAMNRIPTRIAFCRLPVVGPFVVRGLNGFAGPATRMAMHRRSLTRDEKRAYLYPYRSWTSRVAVSEFVQDIPLSPGDRSWPTLMQIEKNLEALKDRPMLIIWGGQDFCFDDHFLNEWTRRFPDARAHRIADAGHYVLEDAREEVVPQLAAFLGA